MRLAPTIRDSRGREHRLRYLGISGRLYAEVGQETFRRLCDRLNPRWRADLRRQRVLVWGRIAIKASIAVLLVLMLAVPRWLVAIYGLFLAYEVWRALMLHRHLPIWRGTACCSLTEALLAEPRCPACVYPLDPENLDQNLYMICAECGAAWFPPLGPEPPRGSPPPGTPVESPA